LFFSNALCNLHLLTLTTVRPKLMICWYQLNQCFSAVSAACLNHTCPAFVLEIHVLTLLH